MKRIALAILAIAFVIGSVAPSFAVEMQARGSWRAAASWYDFDGENSDLDNGETFRARQRARVWFDFIANENLKAVLGLEIGDVTWGNGAGKLGTDDDTAIEVKHAYIDFNVPNTQVNIKAGLQGIYIPGNLGSPILDDDAAALMVSAPVNDMVSVAAGWIRSYDLDDDTKGIYNYGKDNDDDTDTEYGWEGHTSGDEVDTLALLVPVNADGFSVTPYFLYTMIGKNAIAYEDDGDEAYLTTVNTLLGLQLADDFDFNDALGNISDDATMWHAGFSAQIDMFDPIVVLMDAAYGSLALEGTTNDIDVRGYFFDLAVDYKMDFMTPELFFYYTSGADDDKDEISVFPSISADLTFSTFLMDGAALGECELYNSDPSDLPMWAIGLKLKDINLVEDLSHTFTIYYAQGTSDKDGWYGKTFAEDDSLVEVNFDTKYQIYDELAAYVELGYINFDWDKSADHESSTEDAYKAALGIKYDF
jgi:hypothetical protein